MRDTVLMRRRPRVRTVVLAGFAVAALVATSLSLWMRGGTTATHSPHPAVMLPLHPLVAVPAVGLPQPGALTYTGGHVEVTPKTYLVFWGWASTADPVAQFMERFTGAIGGTPWLSTDDQYYEQSGGTLRYITNPSQQLAGVWFDNVDPIHNNLSMQDIASEGLAGLRHFGITDVANSHIVVAQPVNANDAGFNSSQYCAWHDVSTDGFTMPAGTPQFSFISMPYVLNAGANCGEDFVNPAPQGTYDGVTSVLGHEIAEEATDPGAGIPGDTAWADINGNESADKCAWVNLGPGGSTNITGNDGNTYTVQGLWDNGALLGLGYCTN